MKLFTRYNRINLLTTVFIFLLSIIAFYFFLRYVLIRQVNEDLRIEKAEIKTYVNNYQRLPDIIKVHDQDISYTLVMQPVAQGYKTITEKVGEEDLRQLIFSIQVNGKWYSVTIKKSMEGTDNLTRSVATIALVTILLILAASYTVNRVVLRRLWQPFYSTLAAVQHFRLGSNQSLPLLPSSIDEFSFMNDTLQRTTQKAEQDYILLKEFTENASHELQTPLAIIQSKLELLMQDGLSEGQSIALHSANEAIQKLSRFNQSLLLLTKIQNSQFSEKGWVDVKMVIENKLSDFKEIWESKQIAVQFILHDARLMINVNLADLLINNLFSNAMKHNISGGKIDMELTDKKFVISNTGECVAIDENRLFTRFYNPSKSGSNTGLGLSIIKQICDASGFTVQYQFEKDMHRFLVLF